MLEGRGLAQLSLWWVKQGQKRTLLPGDSPFLETSSTVGPMCSAYWKNTLAHNSETGVEKPGLLSF